MEQSRYKPALVAFMSFKDGVNYPADMNFSEQARLNITSEQLCRWMNHRAYGSEQPTKDMKPTHARSSTLELYKKAISSFMPRLTIPWDNVRHEGNPTRSEAVNQLIKTVKRFKSVVRESCPVLDGLLNTACDSEAGHSSTVADTTTAHKDFAAMHSQFFGVKRYIGEVMSEVMRLRTEIQRELHTIKASVNRIAVQPVIRQIHGSRVDPTGERELNPPRIQRATVKLSKRPKDLFEPWHEYEFGYTGVKQARDFTSVERGANKFVYSRRKVFWDEVAGLVRAGFTSDAAIDKVRAAAFSD